jgi:hypothetical protein
MQDMLNKISWVGYAGSLTWSAAMMAVPGGAGVAMTVVGTNKVLNQVFQNTPPVELRKMNGEQLDAMKVNPEIAHAFLNNAVFSPREQTLLVNALSEMNGVADRGALVHVAVPSQNPTVAFFRSDGDEKSKWGDHCDFEKRRPGGRHATKPGLWRHED